MTRILDAGEYKPGDLPPDGYVQWHEWADVQRKAGITQVPCAHCAGWKTPQELSGEMCVSHCKDGRGRDVIVETAICTDCRDRFATRT